MSALFLVLPMALVIAAVAVGAFVWSVRDGQLDDLDSPALRILHDDVDAKAAPTPAAPTDRPSP